METGEKPHETLSEIERQLFALCGDAILWSQQEHVLHEPEALALRDRATKLKAMLGGMDFAHDDRYFKVLQEAEGLRSSLENLKKEYYSPRVSQESQNFAYINLDIENGATPEKVLEALRQQLAVGVDKGVILEQAWIPRNQEGHYGDYIRVKITRLSDNPSKCAIVFVNEMFNPSTSVGKPHLEGFRKKFGEKLQEEGRLFPAHIHPDGTIEISGRFTNVDIAKMEQILTMIIESIIQNPRKFKGQ